MTMLNGTTRHREPRCSLGQPVTQALRRDPDANGWRCVRYCHMLSRAHGRSGYRSLMVCKRAVLSLHLCRQIGPRARGEEVFEGGLIRYYRHT